MEQAVDHMPGVQTTDKFWLNPPFSCVIIGKSGLGKTTLLKHLMQNWKDVAENAQIYKLWLFYQAEQSLYEDIFESLGAETIKEKSTDLPSDLNELLSCEPPSKDEYSILIFDDMQMHFEKDPKFVNFINQLIRVFTHHKNIIPIIILQDNLKAAMGALLNAVTYLFVMPCNNSMLSGLQRYIAPRSDGLIRDIAKKCFNEHKCSHLMIDNSGRVPDNLIYRYLSFDDSIEHPSLVFYPEED